MLPAHFNAAVPSAQWCDPTDATALERRPSARSQWRAARPAAVTAISKARQWLASVQNRDGSFGWGPTGANANSTGLAASALGSVAARQAPSWLHGGCAHSRATGPASSPQRSAPSPTTRRARPAGRKRHPRRRPRPVAASPAQAARDGGPSTDPRRGHDEPSGYQKAGTAPSPVTGGPGDGVCARPGPAPPSGPRPARPCGRDAPGRTGPAIIRPGTGGTRPGHVRCSARSGGVAHHDAEPVKRSLAPARSPCPASPDERARIFYAGSLVAGRRGHGRPALRHFAVGASSAAADGGLRPVRRLRRGARTSKWCDDRRSRLAGLVAATLVAAAGLVAFSPRPPRPRLLRLGVNVVSTSSPRWRGPEGLRPDGRASRPRRSSQRPVSRSTYSATRASCARSRRAGGDGASRGHGQLLLGPVLVRRQVRDWTYSTRRGRLNVPSGGSSRSPGRTSSRPAGCRPGQPAGPRPTQARRSHPQAPTPKPQPGRGAADNGGARRPVKPRGNRRAAASTAHCWRRPRRACSPCRPRRRPPRARPLDDPLGPRSRDPEAAETPRPTRHPTRPTTTSRRRRTRARCPRGCRSP